MKQTHTILFPNMLDIHFRFLENILNASGYHAMRLMNEGASICELGLQYVHNDTCYPALLTIGQMLDALLNGMADPDHSALIMPQTGGGCRASNYVFLLRKALDAAGYQQVPVISLNISGLDSQPGFDLNLPLLRKMLAAMAYGDLLMALSNQTSPYETHKGQTEELVAAWINELSQHFNEGHGYDLKTMKRNAAKIAQSFHQIPVNCIPKIKCGIVGEIYVKYSALANNHLEDFLKNNDCEVMVPGIMQFLLYAADMPIEDARRYGGRKSSQLMSIAMFEFLQKYESLMLDAVAQYSEFTVPASYKELKELGAEMISTGCKMGEGWLLSAEMAELASKGYDNIICVQPFGCLPNHIIGKAMMGRIQKKYPNANVTAIDYDAGSAKVNQENRLRLLLSIAQESLQDQFES